MYIAPSTAVCCFGHGKGKPEKLAKKIPSIIKDNKISPASQPTTANSPAQLAKENFDYLHWNKLQV